MDDIVFLGTKAAGKTTMLSILRGNGVPQNTPPQTDGHLRADVVKVKVKKRKAWFDKKGSIHDTGGKDTNLQTDYKEWIKNAHKVCFVFNGIDFLKEIKSDSGGEIGMRIRNWLLPNFGPNKSKKYYSLFFIATYADQYLGNMRQAIVDCVSAKNKEYKELTNQDNDRYPYLSLLDDSSHFFAVNATDEDEVKAMFNIIFNINIDAI